MLLDSGGIGVIDFQDSLMGPPTYDLASLLRDSYVRLSVQEENQLLVDFEKMSGRALDRQAYVWTSLQRNLKAIGRFHYIHLVKGKETHLPFVKPSLLRVQASLEELGESLFAKQMGEQFAGDLNG
jgi:aminoglycoside/choline kinase family phosphotransferase